MTVKKLLYRSIIIKSNIDDYNKLSYYHYRGSRLGPYKAIYSLCFVPAAFEYSPYMKVVNPDEPMPKMEITPKIQKALDGKRYRVIGVIVYSMPPLNVELRNIATDRQFCGLGRRKSAELINKNIRTISRVIIDPRFRNIGLGTKLVSETMPLVEVPIVEAMAVMGHFNPFFEKAGMKAYHAQPSLNTIRMKQAFSIVGIEEDALCDADYVHKRFENLPAGAFLFLEKQILRFLQNYGYAKDRLFGLDRTRYVLSKLTDRPVYYIWFNQRFTFWK